MDCDMTTAIHVDNLCKQYFIGRLRHENMIREVLVNTIRRPFSRRQTERESIWALKNVSIEVQRGEVVGIIGRNGAGKSTLLKTLSRITYPTSGKLTVRGRIGSLLEVGTGFHQELTGRENVYLNGSILGMKKQEIDAKLDEIVAFAGVEPFIDTPIKRFSSGMRLRLGFAVAAHLEPDILLVDEVLAVGDTEFQKKCLKTMDDLHSGGRTVLFVSHNMAAIENLCSRAIWLDNGEVQRDGPAKETIRDYLATFANAQSAGCDLRHLKTRRGRGGIRFVGVEFLDSDGSPKKVICSGDPLTVRIHYHAERRVSSPYFGLKIYTELGTLISDVNTWSTGFEIPFISPGDGYIDLTIESLRFVPSRYHASLWSASVGPIWYDVVDRCVVFDVEASDVYNSGRGIDSRVGIIYLPCTWRHNGTIGTGESQGDYDDTLKSPG
jgi:lipopolysaccharide transport system ATP-binding protein